MTSSIIGWDLDDLAGVAIGALSPHEQHALMVARRTDPNAVAVVQNQLTNRRRKVLPGDALSLAAGASGTVTYETQELFRPERYIVQGSNAADFTISAIIVGTKNQFAAPGDCPAEIFRPDAVNCDIHFDSAAIGNKIVVTVKNISVATSIFKAAFLGTSVS